MEMRDGGKVADICSNQRNILGWEIISEWANYYWLAGKDLSFEP